MTMTMLMALDPMALVRSLPGNAAQGLIWELWLWGYTSPSGSWILQI